MNAPDHRSNKLIVKKALEAVAESTVADLARRLHEAYHPNAEWRGSHPMNIANGVDAIEAEIWTPLLRSFPDLERRDSILMEGVTTARTSSERSGITAEPSARTG
jgi:hypothetical protein